MKAFSRIYRFHFHDERRERLFLASLAFLLAFGIVRAITAQRLPVGPMSRRMAGARLTSG